MHCASCVINIDGELEDTGKIRKVKTNYAKSQTEVEFDTDQISAKEIVGIIKKVGYNVAKYTDPLYNRPK